MAVLVNDTLQIGYDDFGPENTKAAPVVLLHASGASRRQWRSFVEAESVRRRCLAPDRIGYGETADRRGRASSMAREMAVVHDLRALAGGPVHLVGHSYGGAVAAAYAQAHADELLSLTLIEPVLFHLLRHDGPSAQWDEIARLASSHIAHVEAGRLNDAADAFMTYWLGATAWNAMPAAQRAAVTATMPKVAQEWRQIWSSGRAPTSRWQPTMPVLLIEGCATTPAAKAIMGHLAENLPGAERKRVESAGHLAPITHAATVNALIAEFIAQVDIGGGERCGRRNHATISAQPR
jgi:pimeloyl-ACP methyl ester carboxylesterase